MSAALRRALVVTVAGAVVLSAAAPIGAEGWSGETLATPTATAANSARYTDPTGDATPGGMDITNVTVSNDDAGNLRFVVEIPSHQTLPVDRYIGLYLDADRNNSTGSAGYEFLVWIDGSAKTIEIDRWDAAQSTFVLVSGAVVAGSYSAGRETVDFNRTQIGSVSIFNFAVYTWNAGNTAEDRTDSSTKWTYEVKIGTTPPPSSKVAITSLTREPSQPIAGESFTVTAAVIRVGRPGQVTNGTVYCSPLPGVQARWFGSVGRGRASCRWDIPASAVGKLVKGSIGVSEGGPVTTKRFSLRVLPRTVVLKAGGANSDPKQPQAGKTFYYALTVFVRDGTEKRIQAGTVDCTATIGGRRLEVVDETVLTKEGVRCGWEVPSGTTGQNLRGSVLVRSEGATLRHIFTRRVR